MTELKKDSQSIRSVQTQPSTKKRVSKSTAAKSEEAIDPSTQEKETEATPQPRRRAPKTTTKTTKTKRQATSKVSQPAASTQIKLAWELSQSSIAARFAQLEHELAQLKNQATHINEQSMEILAEMDELREISQKIQAPDAQPRPRTRLSLPLEPPIQEEAFVEPEPVVKQPIPQPSITERSHPPRSEVNSPSVRMRRRRHDRWLKWVLRLPQKPAGMAIDATIWVLAAAGLRIALQFAALQVGILAPVVNILIFLPVLGVVCTALFVPQFDRVGIYRLLLLAVGLFVGGLL
jgi:hypothetical protein